MSTHRRKIPADPEIGKRLKAVLEYRGMTKSQLATAMGVERSAVSQWISGAAKPLDETFRRLAAVLVEDESFLRGKTTGGKKGLGGAVGKLLEKAGAEGVVYLSGLKRDELRRLISTHQGGRKARKGRSPNSPSDK